MTTTSTQRRILALVGVLLLLTGFAARVAPLADSEGRLLRQWPTEDGYLMLTIARNIAIGNGMSTADGELPTNGTQPLATGLWSGVFMAVDGAKRSGVTIILFLELLISVACAFVLYLLASRLFEKIGIGKHWAMLAAGGWYASTLVVPHSMNALESGLYVLCVLLTANAYLRWGEIGDSGTISFSYGQTIALGVFMSLAFWARNDAVFLIAAFCVSCLLVLGRRFGLSFASLPKVLVTGSLTVVLAAPWLIANVLNFGHLMPISGVAQSAATSVGNNAYLVPLVWLEYLTVFLPVPNSLETNTSVIVGLSVVLVIAALLALRYSVRLGTQLRHFAAFIGLYGLTLTGYYGLVHGAPWFMARYLFPLSPFIAILSIGLLAHFLSLPFLKRTATPLLAAGLAGAFIVNAGLNYRIYSNGSYHMHQQVVHWVHDNVRESDWIGAIQTGTLGFFHDRTVNLDGKVNPEALEAVIADTIPDYVIAKELNVLADWYGIHEWAELPGLKGRFDVLVADKPGNLGIIARKDWQPQAGGTPGSADYVAL